MKYMAISFVMAGGLVLPALAIEATGKLPGILATSNDKQIDTDLSITTITSATLSNFYLDAMKNCAQLGYLYSSNNGACIQPTAASDPSVTITGPFYKEFNTTGAYTFTVPDYTYMAVYAFMSTSNYTANSFGTYAVATSNYDKKIYQAGAPGAPVIGSVVPVSVAAGSVAVYWIKQQ